jgi:hypothetical protein
VRHNKYLREQSHLEPRAYFTSISHKFEVRNAVGEAPTEWLEPEFLTCQKNASRTKQFRPATTSFGSLFNQTNARQSQRQMTSIRKKFFPLHGRINNIYDKFYIIHLISRRTFVALWFGEQYAKRQQQMFARFGSRLFARFRVSTANPVRESFILFTLARNFAILHFYFCSPVFASSRGLPAARLSSPPTNPRSLILLPFMLLQIAMTPTDTCFYGADINFPFSFLRDQQT